MTLGWKGAIRKAHARRDVPGFRNEEPEFEAVGQIVCPRVTAARRAWYGGHPLMSVSRFEVLWLLQFVDVGGMPLPLGLGCLGHRLLLLRVGLFPFHPSKAARFFGFTWAMGVLGLKNGHSSMRSISAERGTFP